MQADLSYSLLFKYHQYMKHVYGDFTSQHPTLNNNKHVKQHETVNNYTNIAQVIMLFHTNNEIHSYYIPNIKTCFGFFLANLS